MTQSALQTVCIPDVARGCRGSSICAEGKGRPQAHTALRNRCTMGLPELGVTSCKAFWRWRNLWRLPEHVVPAMLNE